MKNFKIHTPDEPEVIEQTNSTRLFNPGTYMPYINEVSDVFTVQVRFA